MDDGGPGRELGDYLIVVLDIRLPRTAQRWQTGGMELRRAFADDWAAVRDVRLRALTQNPLAFCSTLERELAFDEQAWRSRLAHGITVLAWSDGVPVATVTGKVDPHEAGGKEIVGMWVDPSSRSSGLADSLISTVIEWARTEGAHEIALWVADNNDRARALYLRCGFAVTGERDTMPSGGDEIRMRMPLAKLAM